MNRILAAAVLVLFVSIALEHGRVTGFFRSYQLLYRNLSTAKKDYSGALSQAFPHYHKVTALREKLLEGKVSSVRLIYSGDRAVLQRVAEILYPVRVSDSAPLELHIADKDGEFLLSLNKVLDKVKAE